MKNRYNRDIRELKFLSHKASTKKWLKNQSNRYERRNAKGEYHEVKESC